MKRSDFSGFQPKSLRVVGVPIACDVASFLAGFVLVASEQQEIDSVPAILRWPAHVVESLARLADTKGSILKTK